MNNTLFFKRAYDPAYGDARVVRITVAGSPTLRQDPQSVLHWRIFLVLENECSVTLDMAIGGEGITGVLTVASNSYAVSNTSVAYCNFPVISMINVNQIIGLLVSAKCDKYRFTNEGAGCRFWCADIIGGLEFRGVIARGSRYIFEAYVVQRSIEEPVRFPIPAAMGTFYG